MRVFKVQLWILIVLENGPKMRPMRPKHQPRSRPKISDAFDFFDLQPLGPLDAKGSLVFLNPLPYLEL